MESVFKSCCVPFLPVFLLIQGLVRGVGLGPASMPVTALMSR